VARARRPKRGGAADRRADRKAQAADKKKDAAKKKNKGTGSTTPAGQAFDLISQAPAAQQAGLSPQDYPNNASAFGTGPGEATQYHYTRQDLYAEQYAAEQIAAMQQAASAGASAVPGPGQVTTVSSGMAGNPT
jgi:hypothetical protein